jgi:hypothetical protein
MAQSYAALRTACKTCVVQLSGLLVDIKSLPGPILNLTSHTPGYPIAWYNFIAATMTYTLFMLITRKQGWSIEQFKDHYENKHVPLVMEALKDALPVSHTRYYLKRNDAARGEADVAPPMVFAGDATTVDYDCITKIELRDEQHFKDFNVAFANAPGRAEIQADEEVFADKSKFRLFAIESTEVTKS